MRTRTLAAAMAMAAGTAASAQSTTVLTQRVDDGTEAVRNELMLRASRVYPDVMLAWHDWTAPPVEGGIVNVFYNVAADGYGFRSDPSQIPLPRSWTTYQGADPIVVFSIDGTGWVGHVGFDPHYNFHTLVGCYESNDRCILAKKQPFEPYATAFDPGDPSAQPESPFAIAYPENRQRIDKPALVAGPAPNSGPTDPDVVGLIWAHKDFENDAYHQRALIVNSVLQAYSPVPDPCDNGAIVQQWMLDPNQSVHYPVLDEQLVNTSIPLEDNRGSNGSPSAAVILRNGDLRGRWVFCFGGGAQAHWSPDGVHWHQSVTPMRAVHPVDSPRQTEPITFLGDYRRPHQPPLSGFTRENGGPQINNFPAIAADPTDENKIYMVFTAATPSTGVYTSSNPIADNVDLFIARSTDGGQNFSGPVNDPGARVLHLTDDDLDDPPNAVQFMPSVTVDKSGRVQVMYYVGTPQASNPGDDPIWQYQVKLVTIENFAVEPHPTSNLSNTILFPDPNSSTTYFDLEHELVNVRGPIHDFRRFLGDYIHGIDSRACETYCGYIARPANSTLGPAVYVSTMRVNDANCLPGTGNCYANCDGSTTPPVLNVADFTCFLQQLSAGCDTPITGPVFNPGPCYANCDGSTVAPFLNIGDYTCFLQHYSAGCQ